MEVERDSERKLGRNVKVSTSVITVLASDGNRVWVRREMGDTHALPVMRGLQGRKAAS